MKSFIILLTLSLYFNTNMQTIYTFSSLSNSNEWRVLNDGVMGGISESALILNKEGYGEFSGHVSLENYGGFASIQLNQTIKLDKEKTHIVLRVKGDGKRYEFRMKGNSSQYESYVHQFPTSGEWETIKLPIAGFYPQFRGQRMNAPNFNFEQIGQLSFLIANKQEEDFKLLLDWIGLE